MNYFELRKNWVRVIFGKITALSYYPDDYFSRQFYWNSQFWSYYDKQSLIKNAGKPIYNIHENFCVKKDDNGYCYVKSIDIF